MVFGCVKRVQKVNSSMIEHFSATSLGTLFTCAYRFYLRYIHEPPIKKPPGISAYVGRSVDESVNQNMISKKDSNVLLPQEQIIDIVRDALNHEWETEKPFLNNEEKKEGEKKVKGQCVDTSIGLAKLHYNKLAPVIKPKQIQRKWEIEISGFSYGLMGYIDVMEENSIRDTKTTKIKKTGAANKSLQLTIYALAGKILDKKDYDLFFDYLVANKTPITDVQPTKRTQKDFEVFFRRLEIAAKFIETGIFPPASQENNWFCSPAYCGYHDICPYV